MTEERVRDQEPADEFEQEFFVDDYIENPKGGAVTAKDVFRGHPFRRRVDPQHPDRSLQTRRVGITLTEDETGDNRFYPSHTLPDDPTRHHHYLLADADRIDPAYIVRSASTARKQKGGASTPYVDTEATYIEGGGQGIRIDTSQLGGFTSDAERCAIEGLHHDLGDSVDR